MPTIDVLDQEVIDHAFPAQGLVRVNLPEWRVTALPGARAHEHDSRQRCWSREVTGLCRVIDLADRQFRDQARPSEVTIEKKSQQSEAAKHRPTSHTQNNFPDRGIEKLAQDFHDELQWIALTSPLRNHLPQSSHPLPGDASMTLRRRRHCRIEQDDEFDVLADGFELSRHLISDHPTGAHSAHEIGTVRLLLAYDLDVIRRHIFDAHMRERNAAQLSWLNAKNSKLIGQSTRDVAVKQGLAVTVMNKEEVFQSIRAQLDQRPRLRAVGP